MLGVTRTGVYSIMTLSFNCIHYHTIAGSGELTFPPQIFNLYNYYYFAISLPIFITITYINKLDRDYNYIYDE